MSLFSILARRKQVIKEHRVKFFVMQILLKLPIIELQLYLSNFSASLSNHIKLSPDD